MRKRTVCRAAAVLLAGATPAAGWAQAISQADTQRGVTVLNRSRPDFDPLGVRLGNFRLDGSAEAGLGYDSNVFGRHSNVKSDGYAGQAAELALNSGWTTHALGASAQMASREYFSRNSLDWQDYNVGGYGRYDFSADTNVEGRYRHYREHLDVYNFDVQSAGIVQPVPYTSDEVQATGSTRLNRVGLLATGVFRTYRFEDTSIAGIRQRTSLQDFNTAIGGFGASYAISPGRYVNAIFRVQDISYTASSSSARNSFTYEGLIGFTYDFDGVWSGRLAIGWRQRNYNGAQFKSLEGVAAEGGVSWSPTQLTTVRFSVQRSIEESIRIDSVSYQRTQGGFAVDHELLRNVILTGDARIDRREYQRPIQVGTDAIFTAQARWLINRNLQLVGSFQHTQRVEATGGIQEYGRNVIELRLRVAL